MPLSEPTVPRTDLHRRRIECRGYKRDDGLWDIEGRIIDTKSYAFKNRHRGGMVQAGEHVHDMSIRLTLDLDFKVVAVEAVSDFSPYRQCPLGINERFQVLKGLTIGPGWNQKVRELLGGVNGCTHMVELLGPIATTAVQTMIRAREERTQASTGERAPTFLNTCHALASSSDVVREFWPAHYTGDAGKDPE